MPTEFTFPIRVYYEDTDAVGLVYHANYLKFMERARTEILRNLDPILCSNKAPAMFVAAEAHLNYLRPCHLNDLLEVHSIITNVGHARLDFKQKVQRGNEVCCEGTITIVCVNENFRPCALPRHLREMIKHGC